MARVLRLLSLEAQRNMFEPLSTYENYWPGSRILHSDTEQLDALVLTHNHTNSV
jgi:hypothetical protein